MMAKLYAETHGRMKDCSGVPQMHLVGYFYKSTKKTHFTLKL